MIKISVSIDVSNLKKAETFYVEALGCKKLRDQGSDMVVLSVENADIYLQEKEPGTKPLQSNDVVRDYKRHWTPIHLFNRTLVTRERWNEKSQKILFENRQTQTRNISTQNSIPTKNNRRISQIP